MVRGVIPNSLASSEIGQVGWLMGEGVRAVYVNVTSCHNTGRRKTAPSKGAPWMNLNEQRLTYPFGDTLAEPGTAMHVADGLRWIRMPLPFALDHINLWLLRDQIDGRDGWTVVDCGVARPEVQALWETIFADALEGLP